MKKLRNVAIKNRKNDGKPTFLISSFSILYKDIYQY